MLGVNVTASATAAGAALVVALLVGAMPAQGAPATPSGETPVPTTTGTTSPPATPTPTTTATPTRDDVLLPDLIALPASEPRVQTLRDGRRLRFTSALGNIGAGPIEVRPNNLQPCPAGQHNSTQIVYLDGNGNGRFNPKKDTDLERHPAGCMVYHPYHHHWHFKASARYSLLDPSQEGRVVVSARRKVSFCLRDSARLPDRYGSFDYPERYSYCTRRSPQGISVGWMDVYQSFLAGQALRLPKRMKNGLYCLETVVDPIDQLDETNDDNNSSVRALRIRGNRVVVRPTRRCR